jgi:hypothetical protein
MQGMGQANQDLDFFAGLFPRKDARNKRLVRPSVLGNNPAKNQLADRTAL